LLDQQYENHNLSSLTPSFNKEIISKTNPSSSKLSCNTIEPHLNHLPLNYNDLDGIISARQQKRCIAAAQDFLTKNPKYYEKTMGFDVIIMDKQHIALYIRDAWTL
jgi:hypothetical protein